MSQYFPKRYQPFGGDINLRADLSSLKTEVDKLDIDKLVPVPVDLSKLSDVVKTMLLTKLYMIN